MKKHLLVLLCFLMIGGNVLAATFKGGGYVACLSEDLFNQITATVVNKDDYGFAYLLKHGCIITKKGTRISVLDRSIWNGWAKVRAYTGDASVVLWTNLENISP